MENPAGDVPVISDTCNSWYVGLFCKLEREHKQPLLTCQPRVGFNSHTVCGLLREEKPSKQQWDCDEGERWEPGGVMAPRFGPEQRGR